MLHGILEDAAAVGIHGSEVGLRKGVALLGGQAEPAHGFGLVLEDTLAVGIQSGSSSSDGPSQVCHATVTNLALGET